MPTLHDTLARIRFITFSSPVIPVLRTVAGEYIARFCPEAQLCSGADVPDDAAAIWLGIGRDALPPDAALPSEAVSPRDERWMRLRSLPGGSLELHVSHAEHLYFFAMHVAEALGREEAASCSDGRYFAPAFPVLRPSYDVFLTQHDRMLEGFDREAHVRSLARGGFTHVEVNGLAVPVPLEQGPKGEVLHRFYTYCPALDQFVASRLNRGFYDPDYLSANLARLRSNAELGERYGLASGLTCFEPRSVPDTLLAAYPMLRGARVDHPLRSFHPRYNLTVAHPVVLRHYEELLQALLRAAPSVDHLSIWSNDSGAGFEYTGSLYVGRNGGGYVIREWKDDDSIASAAARNILRFLRTLRDAGRALRPDFRVLLRLEPFWAEYDMLWQGLEDGMDVEVSSLLSTGWGLRYSHPTYPEVREIHGTALFHRFDASEGERIADLRRKRSEADFYFSPDVVWNHEPLMGLPFPWLLHGKLCDLHAAGAEHVCSTGGMTPPTHAPYHINREVLRAFQADPAFDLDAMLLATAHEYCAAGPGDEEGEREARALVALWKDCDEAFRHFPIPVMLYASWGVWYRLFVRPIVPDIEAIPEDERAYYEDFLLAPPHNRARIDFRYDVGFDLVDPAHALHCARLMDSDLFPQLDAARARAVRMAVETAGSPAWDCYRDLSDRMRAWRSWLRTQRNVALWIAGVHGYLETTDEDERQRCRAILRDMVLDEIANARNLLALWESSSTPWLITSGGGETSFIYGANFGDLLRRKIALMTGRENDEPRVDPDFQWRVPGL